MDSVRNRATLAGLVQAVPCLLTDMFGGANPQSGAKGKCRSGGHLALLSDYARARATALFPYLSAAPTGFTLDRDQPKAAKGKGRLQNRGL